MEEQLKKAGIIIVGNEILKGHVNDLNSAFLCKRFHAIGVKVCRISTVPDEKNDIAEEVARFSEKFDIVVTTGGIGPTHDDITYEAVAEAVGDKIVMNSEMAEVISSYFHESGDVKNNPTLKMALIPQSSKLIYILPKQEKNSWLTNKHNGLQEEKCPVAKKPFPIVQVKNIYILPGMMEWLEHSFDHLQKIFENPDVKMYTMILFLTWPEVKILNELNKAVNKYENLVLFGSYPSNFSGTDFVTKIVLESTSIDDVTSAYSYLKSLLPLKSINENLEMKDAELVKELTNGNKSICNLVRNSLKVCIIYNDEVFSIEKFNLII